MKKLLLTVGVISAALSIVGCLTMAQHFKNYGSILSSNDVTEAFESKQVNPGLDYYFIGPEGTPDVVIGLNKGYRLDSTLWKKITLTPEALKAMISSMQSLARKHNVFLHGFTILDNQRMPIGVWYSLLKNPTYIRMESEKLVDIGTPSQSGRLSRIEFRD